MKIGRCEDQQGHTHVVTLGGDGRWMEAEPVAPWRWAATDRPVEVRRWLPPLEPAEIWAVGKNYAEHAREFDSEIPENPILFLKPRSSVIAAGEPIRIPRACEHGPEVDYEVELAVVIGPEPVCDVPVEKALNTVLGYTIANDVTARRWQKHGGAGQWSRGKSFDTFCPLGPVLVTADEIPDPNHLSLRTELNGRLLQDGTTADMIFSVAQLIAFISRDTTLQPGTVILTGTPDGVGFARKPPIFLTPGDQVTVEIPPIGKLTNPVHAAGEG